MSFLIATYNANSIRTRLEQVISWMTSTGVDLLCVQETKVQDEDFPVAAFSDAGLHVYYAGQKAHAGVAIVSREELADVRCGLDDDGPPDCPRLIAASVRGIHVLNAYVPQGRSIDHEMFQYKLAWFDRLRAQLERRFAVSQPVLLCGDLNVAPQPIDIHDPKANAEHVDYHPLVREAFARLCDWGLIDVFRKHHPEEPGQYSYFDYRVRNAIERGVGWRIDHLLATAPLADRCTGAWIDLEARRAERPSDHTFVVAAFDL
ncbi:MAG: exodeoxyribonuclease III [Anaerolineae bacterium]